MRLKIKQILNLKSVKDYLLDTDELYLDYVDLFGETLTSNGNTLFLPTYCKNSFWYKSAFDRTSLLTQIKNEKMNIIPAIEKWQLKYYSGKQYIIVSDLNIFMNEICNYIRTIIAVKIIGITGSVGKTTLANLLYKTFNDEIDTQIIKSKRLTPLIIYDFFINHLSKDTKLLIAEIGLFYKNQIKELTEILKPDYSVVLSIYEMHIGWNGLFSKRDLFIDKHHIANYSSLDLFFNEDCCKTIPQKGIDLSEYNITYQSDMSFSMKISQTEYDQIYLYIKSQIYFRQVVVVLELYNAILKKKIILKKLNNVLKSQECYSLKKRSIGESIVFIDDHATLSGYFQSNSELLYEKIILIIASVNFSDEKFSNNQKIIADTFHCYSGVYIVSSLTKYFRDEKINYISKNEIRNLIMNNRYIILHDPYHEFKISV